MGRFVFVLLVVGVCSVWGAPEGDHVSPVEQCPGENFENLKESVIVSPCGKTKCKLHKGTDATITIRFKPKKDVKELVTIVNANIAGLDLPFLGVSGTSACGKIKHAQSGEDASCPLKADEEYIYTNSFHIEEFYPLTELRVHWSLHSGEKNLICFEVPARIKT
ncbi:hypothetical protein O0L34_g927 [Tuta absoluta]|nr:hypothetical protein O0L34_g927 [Tuta absoluta]